MKLRINTKLRAALIAAITTVGFTLTQAQATWEGGANEGSEYYTNTGRTNLHLTNTSDDLITFTAEQNHVTAGIAEVVTKDLATVRVRGGNHWGPGRAFDMLTIDSIKAGDGSGTVFVNAEKYNDSQAASNSTATVLGINGTLGGVQNYGVLTLGADGGTINASGAIMNNSGATLTLNGTYTFDTKDASNYVTRTEGDVVWSDEANQQGFKKSTGSTFYVIKGATEGTNFSVTTTGIEKESSGNYYFTAGEVTDHSKFYVNAATATLGEDFSGQLVVNKADATVTLDNAAFSGTITGEKVNLIVQNGATLTLTNQTAFGSTDNTFTIGAGSTIDLNGQADGNYKYTLAGGTITNSGGNIGDGSSQTVALILTKDSTVNAGSGHDFRLLGRGFAATSLDLGGKTLVKTGAGLFGLVNTTVTAGTIEVREGTFQFSTAHGTANSAANITFNGGDVTGAMNLTADVSLTALQNASSAVGINAQNHGLTLDGAANLTLTGTITNVAGITKTGAGTATITASGSLNKSIAVQQGSLVLSGTYAIDDIALDPDSTVIYYDSTGAAGGTSGFRNVAGAKSAYTVAQDASVDRTGATFTVNGQAVDLNEQGKYMIAGSTDYSTLWANKGDTVDYAAYKAYADEHQYDLATVRVADGGTVNLNGGTVASLRFDTAGAVAGIEGTGTISSLAGTGLLNLHAGARAAVPSLTVNSAMGVFSTGPGVLAVEAVTISGSGSIEFDSSTEIGTTHLTGGSITFGGTGTTHTLTDLGLSQEGGSASTVNVEAGTTVHIVGTTVAKDRDSRMKGSFSLSHWSATNTVNVNGTLISDVVVSSCDGKGVINVNKGGRLEMRDGLNRGAYNDNDITINVESGATLAAGTTHNTAETKESAKMVVNMKDGSTFEAYYGEGYDTAIINKTLALGDGTVTLNAGEAGKTLQLNSSLTGTGTITKTGEGALILAGDGNYISNTIDLKAGTIVLAGGFDVSDIEHQEGEIAYFENPDGPATANGFAKYTGEVQLVSSNFAKVSVGQEGVILLDGYSVDYDATTGKAGGTISLAAFYVNEGEANVSTIHEASATAAVMLADGAKLIVDEDLSSGVYSTGDDKGFVEIKDGKTLGYSPLADVELSGEGTYDLGSGNDTFGEVSLAEDWSGTVKLSGITTKNLDLNNYGREGSVVEVDGWASHLNNTDASNIYTYNPTLRLTGDGMTVTDGYSGRTYIFAGGVEGDGDFTYGITTSASNQTYVFSGDVSDWSGAFQASGVGKTSTLQFYGEATDVHAAIQNTAGTLNLVVGNGTDKFATVFNGEVTASSITVKTDASATFNELHITSAINNSGTVIFNSDLVVTGFQEIASEEGYYDLNGAFSSDGNGYSGSSDSYLTIVNGGTVQGKVTVEQEGTVYTMSSDGRALKGDGHVYSYETYHVNDGMVKISDIADSGHGTTAVEVAYGMLDVDRAGSGIDITVTGMATVTGEGLDASQVGIESEAVANFGESLELDGVKFSSDSIGVAVYNSGEDAAYSLDNTDMVVSATGITKTIGEDVIVSNWLTVEEITNVEGGTLTLNGMEDAVEVANITVGPDSTVEILSAPETEATITVTEELAAGGGTLLANLVMADDSALLVQGVQKNLHVGSTLTMGSNIALDGTTLQALDGLAVGDYFWLIDAAAGRELSYTGPTGEDAWYDSVFSRIAADSDYELNGDFNIVFSDTDGFGLQKFSSTPEPTTGTLSLLALAALAARRRRK